MPGVGICERRELSSGKIITTVYPSVKYRKKPCVLENLVARDKSGPTNQLLESCHGFSAKTEHISPFELARKRHQNGSKLYHTFLNGIPGITQQCINASEYVFENGLRKVRFVMIETKRCSY